MKPIQLILSGLHSYREKQVIDFETLCEAGLFGIFGPTGSGKSTVLDAITLALYGQVVRMGGTSHPQQVLNQMEERLFVSFTFDLGKGEGRKRYTIEREFGIDKKGNKRQPEVRLIQRALTPGEPDLVLESKATLATQAIEKLIGLTIHDFTRAVVLPQGQFSKFLTLKGSERNEMLQRIFHLHEYGEKLNERLRAAYEANKAELHQLQLELARLGEAGPEALLAATTELQAVQEQEQALKSQHEEIEERKREMEQLLSVQQEWQQVTRRLRTLQEDEARMEALHRQIKEIEASIQIWPLIERLKKLEAERIQTEAGLIELRTKRDHASLQFEAEEAIYQEAVRTLRSEEPVLMEQKSMLSQALEWERELSELHHSITLLQQEMAAKTEEAGLLAAQLAQDDEKLARWKQELAVMDQRLQELAVTPEERRQAQAMLEAKKTWLREKQTHTEHRQEVQKRQRQLEELSRQMHELHNTWQTTTEKRQQNQLNLQEVQEQPVVSEQELEAMRDSLAQVKTIGKEWREVIHAENEWKQKQAKWKKEWDQAAVSLRQLTEKVTELEQHRLDCLARKQEAESQLRDWQKANMALALRSSLTPGSPCPVCGSSEHHITAVEPHPAGQHQEETALEQQLAKTEQDLAEAERKIEQMKEELQKARINEAALQQRETSLAEEGQLISSRMSSIREQLQELGESWVTEGIEQLITRYQQVELEWKQKMAHKEAQKLRLEELQQQQNQLREQELQQKADYDKQLALHTQLAEQLSQLEARLVQSTALVEQAEIHLHEVRGELPIDLIEEHHAALEKQEIEFGKVRESQAALTSQIKQLETDYQQKKEKKTELSGILTMMDRQAKEKQAAYAEKKQQWSIRTGGVPASNRLAELEQKLSMYRQAQEAAEKKRNDALEAKQRIHEELLKLEEALLQVSRQYNEAKLSVEQALLRAGLDLAQVEAAYQLREQLAGFREQVEAHQLALAQLRYDQQKLQEKLAGRSVDENEWQAILQAWQEMQMAWEAVKEQLVIAARQLNKIQENHQRWLEVHRRHEEIVDEQSRLDDLKKLFEGKAFVQFIAEEKLASIARDASYHLARMTKNRYALEIGAEGEFILRDEAAGGYRRAVSTLSGGETFLTSLALALALSVEIQMRGSRLEFFFLDEGFGTLDPELLEVVLDALERLRMDDFAIGLISHVPEIRERMPRRLVVTPAEPMGRGSQISLEIE